MKRILVSFCIWIGVLSVLAQNSKGIAPAGGKVKEGTGKTWAVVVGISDYQNPDIPDLAYAHVDAASFVAYLKSPAGGKIEESHIVSLLNEKATAGQFASALDWLMENVKEGDQAIIYFSGHGDVERKTITQPGFLLCWDSPAKVYMGGGTFGLVYLQEIISTLSIQMKAKVVVITDACRSGKLAGSEIGGSQATAANLAKQYANEIKIMSCQPDELSLEGPEWGGGRGVFSYFLLNGLTGLADSNKDGSVTLFEIERYLGDKVTEATSPRSQIPLAIGTKSITISTVDQPSLLALKNHEQIENYATGFVASVDQKTKEESKVTVDPILLEKYAKFKKALKEGHLIFPEENSAFSLFQQIKDKPFIASEQVMIQSNLAAALQDEAQQAMNDYLKADPKELRKRWSFDDRYEKFPIYLNKAAELLGQTHFLYTTIKAREHYFTGLNKRFEGERKKDSILIRQAYAEQMKTIQLDSNAAYAYNELGLLERRFNNFQRAIEFFNKASYQSPKWVFPWANLCITYADLGNAARAIQYGQKAITMDPSSPISHYNLGKAYELQSDWNKASEHFATTFQLDSLYFNALFQLGLMFKNLGNNTQAEYAWIKYSQLMEKDPWVYYNLACVYNIQGKEEKALQALEMSFELGFKEFNELETDTDLKTVLTNPKYIELKKKYFQ